MLCTRARVWFAPPFKLVTRVSEGGKGTAEDEDEAEQQCEGDHW